MTAGTAPRPVRAHPVPSEPHAAPAAVVRLLVRQVRRGTAVVAGLSGGLAALVVVQYRDVEGAIGMASLAALAENPAIRTLFGPPVALDDPGGFTVWRTGTVLAVLVGIWAALTATRVTRAEEEAGRWDLLLAGAIPLRSLVLRALAVVFAAAAVPGAAVTAGLLLAGSALPGSVLFGAVLAGTGMAGAALGVLAAQLLAERRTASGLAVAGVLAGLLVRMVGDGVPALDWLHWGTPFGFLGLVAPFAGDRPAPLLILAVVVAVPAVLAVGLVEGRDVGSGLLRAGARREAASHLVASLPGLAVHRLRRPVLTWGAGLAAYFLLIGLLATAMVDFLRDNPLFAELAAQAGMVELGSVGGYAASLFSLLAIPLGAFAAGRMAAGAQDETAGRLTLLYSLPVRRTRWAATEAAVIAVGCLVLALVAGSATWVGAAWVGAGLGPAAALAGALNVVPVALLCLGTALFALGWAPSAVLPLGVLPAAGGYLLLALADTFRWPAGVRELSPFAYLASVPAEAMDVGGAIGLLAVALLLAGAGLAGYARRDLRG